MDPEKKKALEEKLLRLFENQETKVVERPVNRGIGNVIRRRKGQPDKRLSLPEQSA
ncbi:hypothetical protein [Desulfatibacillum aliphaticivorans]|uniref:Uncharacterized protein n=1 Tax=Desulfatibacillum aliphaticivorans TaxID=218208 RepID=B8FC85_DESAL|nr:hypothetical protein [Desulfatibacillum aliphaticivorans]ACL05503.1 hypothetical protein Dalk_3817 [Desulfatibacillum aliphaticivorans]